MSAALDYSKPQRSRALAVPALAWLRASSLLRNSVYLMGTTVVTSLLGYLYWVVAARAFPVAEVGLASAFIAAMTMVASVSNLGIGSAVIQSLPQRRSGSDWSLTVNSALVTVAISGLLAGALAVVALPRIAPMLGHADNRLALVGLLALGTTAANMSVVLDSVFIAERAAGKMLARNSAFAILKLAMLLVLVLIPTLGAIGIFASWITASAVTLVAGGALLLPRLARGYTLNIRGLSARVRGMVARMAGHHIINLGGVAPMYLLPLIVTLRLSAAENAYFYTTWMVGSLFFMVSSSVSSSLFAEGAYQPADLARKVRSSARIISLLLAPAMLFFLVAGGAILGIFGPAYALHGRLLLVVLVFSAIPDAITNIAVSALRVRHRLGVAALLSVGMGAVALALAWLLLPRLGIAGAGWAWLIAESVGSVAVGGVVVSKRSIRGTRRCARMLNTLARRLTLRNMAGLARYIWLRLRFQRLRVGIFYIGRGAEMRIGPVAEVHIGGGLRLMRDFTGHFHGRVNVGENVFFNRGCYVCVYSELEIGDNCLFGEHVSIHDENHVVAGDMGPRADLGFDARPIHIGHNVWVGAKATILPGVRIGDNAVIGANAVVTKDIPANCVAVGIPARVVRRVDALDAPPSFAPDGASINANRHASTIGAPIQ